MDTDNYRSQKIPATTEIVSSDLPQGWVYADPVPALVWVPSQVTLEERKAPNQLGPRHMWKDWEHYKIASSQSAVLSANVTRSVWWPYADRDIPITSSTSFYNYWFGEVGKFNQGLPEFASSAETGFVYSPSGLDELRTQALNAMLPTIKPELSLINSIVELKDFKSLPRTLKGIKDLGLGGQGSLKSLLVAKAKGVLPALKFSKNFKWVIINGLRVAADVYLQKMFNIAPLISDIVALSGAVSVAEKRLRRIINDAGRPVTAHWGKTLQEFANSTDSTERIVVTDSQPVFCNFRTHYWVKWYRYVYYQPTRFHAEVQMSWTLSEFQRAHARLLGLLDVVGVNLNPVIIWNALKWSFVADWVLGINSFLSSLRIGNMDPVINIHRFLFSFKRCRQITVVRESGSWTPEGHLRDVKTVACPMVLESSYKRSCQTPSIASLRTSGLSPTEISLGAALGVSLVHRRKHHH